MTLAFRSIDPAFASSALRAIDERLGGSSIRRDPVERARRKLDRFVSRKRVEIARAIDSRDQRLIRELSEVWVDHWAAVLGLDKTDAEAAKTRLREPV